MIKATKVDGIYDKDPKKFTDARKFEQITYFQALQLRLEVLDSTAFAMCMENRMPLIVLDLFA